MKKKTWIIALTFGLPWSVFMIIFNSIINNGTTLSKIVFTLMFGIIGGFAFAWGMQYMAKNLFEKIIVEVQDGENVIKEGGANHFKGKEGVGGKLVLTDKRLIFKSHKFNIQNHQDIFEIDQISKIQVNRTFKFIENRLILELVNGETHQFIIDEPQNWFNAILNQKQKIDI